MSKRQQLVIRDPSCCKIPVEPGTIVTVARETPPGADAILVKIGRKRVWCCGECAYPYTPPPKTHKPIY